MSKAKVLLVGIGGYGENYIKEFLERDIPNAELVGVADPFIDKSPYRSEIEKRGIAICRSPESFYLEHGKVDLTVISSPIHTHYGYIVSAFKAGSNVLTEKPVVIDLGKLDHLIALEKETGLFASVGYQLCFSRDVLKLKEDILSGVFGKPLRMKSIRMMRRGDKYYARNGWAGKLKCHGDYVFDSPVSNACAHQIQNMLYLLGPTMEGTADVVSVDAGLYKGRPQIENYDAASLLIKTDRDVDILYWTAHCIDEAKVGPRSEFEFENATIYEDSNSFKAVFRDGREIDYSLLDKGDRMQKLYDSIDAALDGSRPCCTLSTSRAHVKAVLLAEKHPVYLCYDAEKKTLPDGDGYYSVPGLSERFQSDYRDWKITDTGFDEDLYQIKKGDN